MSARGSQDRTIAYQPALDGLRAVAVTMVLCFHAGFNWMRGGYFGVSMFFTLSGFLVTALLLAEVGTNGSLSLGRFYARRARRLLPASLVSLLAIVAARALGEFALVPNLSRQLTGAVLQVYNWVQLSGGSSYAALFGRAPALTSPVEHYWSLAIEEQFYLLWPLVLGPLALHARRRNRSVLRPILVLTLCAAVVAPVIAMAFGSDAAYWATPARLGEVLVGACAAAWLAGGAHVPEWAHRMAPVALVGTVILAVALPAGSGPAYTGWLTPLSIVTGLLLLALQVPGRVRTLLSSGPLVWLGRVSYGVYLYHWPVFVLLRQRGWELDRLPGFPVAMGVTLVCATASYVLLEQPIRRSGWAPRRTFVVASSGLLVTLLAVVAMPATRGLLEPNQRVLDAAAIDAGGPPVALVRVESSTSVAAVTSTSTTVPTTTEPMTTMPTTAWPTTSLPMTTLGPLSLPLPATPNRPVRILMVGDSTAFSVGQGLAEWAVDHPADAQVDVLWCQGCGFILDGTITSFDGVDFLTDSRDVVERQLAQRIERLHPDVVVLMTTVNDVANRKWDDTEGPLSPLDPLFRERMARAYASVSDTVVALGVPSLVWVIPPIPTSEWDTPEMGEPDRYRVQHTVIREVAVSSGSTVAVTDLDAWLNRSEHAADTGWRPDGTHFAPEAAKELATAYLGPWLMGVVLGASLS